MKTKKNRPRDSGADTLSQLTKQITVPPVPVNIPTLPPGFGSAISPPSTPQHGDYSELEHIYETLFSSRNDVQGIPDLTSFTNIEQYGKYLLDTIINAEDIAGQKTSKEQIREQPEDPRGKYWGGRYDWGKEIDDITRRRGIVDVIPTITDIDDVIDELPDPFDDTGDQPGGESDNIHDDDEPPSDDTKIKDKLPSTDPSCGEVEAYLSSKGFDIALCSGHVKEIRVVGKA